jgi:hypothetical protein
MGIEIFRDIHEGERCFIAGTGPSLNITKMELLRNDIVIGVNSLHNGLRDWGISCKYYGVADDAVLKAQWKGIVQLKTTLFLSTTATNYYNAHKSRYAGISVYPITFLGGGNFSQDIAVGGFWGGTVVHDVGLQLAYYMGFSEVYLVGVDCDYSGEAHFDGTKIERMAMGAAGKWNTVFEAYQRAKDVFESEGRKIINCTVGGKLEIFDRMNLEDLFNGTN